jgi:cleavage stimulation factor subunit 3
MADVDSEHAFLMSMQDKSTNGTSAPALNGATTTSKQSKMIGGFIDDGEEDSDEEYNPVDNIQEVAKEEESVKIERGISATSQQSQPQSPASAVTSHASLEAPQTQNHIVHSVVVPQADTSVPPATPQVVGNGNEAEIPVNVLVENLAASVDSAPVPTDPDATPPSRLPRDRIGLLEDRIKEDPRGDVEAWLSLISEHQKRNKLDEARAVYERFFAVFPQAVSANCIHFCFLAYKCI